MNGTERCPVCGTALEEFKRSGLLGCAHCYTVFREEIYLSARRVQGKIQHVGKIPSAQEGKYSFIIEQQHLKEGIERAMREKRYAEAEELKEKLFESNRTLREEEVR